MVYTRVHCTPLGSRCILGPSTAGIQMLYPEGVLLDYFALEL